MSARGSPRGSATASPFLSRSGSPVLIEQGAPCLPCVEPHTAADAKRQIFWGGVLAFVSVSLLALAVVGYFVLRHDISHAVRTAAALDDPTTTEFAKWADNAFDPIMLSAYFYNVLNPLEIMRDGAKPVLEEVGPFVYKDLRTHFNFTYSDDRSELAYKTFERYEFVPSLSVEDHSREVLTPNLPYLTLQANLYPNVITREFLFKWYENYTQAETLFTRRSVRELLFGYPDPVLEKQTHLGYPGVLLNMTSRDKAYPATTIYTGKDAPRDDLFRSIKAWRGEEVFRLCPTNPQPCANVSSNELAWGTVEASLTAPSSDGSQLPPGVDAGSSFYLFNLAALRRTRFVNAGGERSVVKGVHCLRFRIDEREMLNFTSYAPNAAYYQGTPAEPLSDGFFNLSHILANVEVFVSRPHLLGVGEPAASSVVALYVADVPEEGFIDIEPVTGTSMQLLQRSQFNFRIKPLPGMPVHLNEFNESQTWFENVTDTIVPVVWFEDVALIDDSDASDLRGKLYEAKEFTHLSLYLGAPLCFLAACAGVWLVYAARTRLRGLEGGGEGASLLGGRSKGGEGDGDERPGELLDNTGVGLYGSTSAASAASAPVAVRPKARRATGPVTVTGSPRDIVHARSPPSGSGSRRKRSSSSREGSSVDLSYN